MDARTAEPVGTVAYPAWPSNLRAWGDGTWRTADNDHVSRWAPP